MGGTLKLVHFSVLLSSDILKVSKCYLKLCYHIRHTYN